MYITKIKPTFKVDRIKLLNVSTVQVARNLFPEWGEGGIDDKDYSAMAGWLEPSYRLEASIESCEWVIPASKETSAT